MQYGGTRNETSLRAAFQELLSHWARGQELELVPEVSIKVGKNTIRPDGTLKNALRQSLGYWESKDESDDLETEIQKKFAKGYPKDNILFEDTQTAVLIQHAQEVARAEMSDNVALHKLLETFFSFEPTEVTEFRLAIEHFRTDLPDLLEVLRLALATASKNKDFKQKRATFVLLCQQAMNPSFTDQDAGEMLIQHILTGEIFKGVFDNAQYFEENNIAQQLEALSKSFYVGAVRRDVDSKTKTYYGAIKAAAAQIADHHEKQKFLKVLYETFYRAYNPAGADKLGIFYTPNEIVRFMIEATDALVEKHFGKNLADQGVEILDPATGTGTFITELIEYLPKSKLEQKYKFEMHCNELALLPYYIANLNIEATYAQKMGKYQEFQNIILVDTLDNTGFGIKGAQTDLFTSLTEENLERIKRQNQRSIHVIIGNPPYRANQANENDNNKNREYQIIDKRIKETYIAASTAQKTKLYDMYARFLRWATDRLQDNGMIAFVSNSSFIDSRTFDGFRKVVAEEFNDIYIINMKGNANTSGERRKRQGGNVFNDQIKVGVAVYFLVKREGKTGCQIHYLEIPDYWGADQKKAFFQDNRISSLTFEKIHPDEKHNWLNQPEHDWEAFLPIASKESKAAKTDSLETTIFKFFSTGVSTNRDEWIVDFSAETVNAKMKFFIAEYQKHSSETEQFEDVIKWSRNLKRRLAQGKREKFLASRAKRFSYRPYSSYWFYDSDLFVDEDGVRSEMGTEGNNPVLALDKGERASSVLATNYPPDLHFNGDSQCLPLYRYENGQRLENITDFALLAFQNHYADTSISREHIFAYVYAVLHHSAYRQKYALNLRQEFPRVPFYDSLMVWVAWGQQLLTLHLDFESATPYPLEEMITPPETENPEALERLQKAKLKADVLRGEIILDGISTLRGVPPEAWGYKLGNRSALEWILERYKETTPKDPTIKARFNTYRFADYKIQVLDLLRRVCTVSCETMKILAQMPSETL